jgi:CspA family cold shock protein
VASAVVREWHHEDGWGVLDCRETPGGCWAHFSHVEMDGYKSLTAGQRVELEWEAFRQEGFEYRAVLVTPPS